MEFTFLVKCNVFTEKNINPFMLQLYVNLFTNLSTFTYCTLETVAFNDFLGHVQMQSLSTLENAGKCLGYLKVTSILGTSFPGYVESVSCLVV